MRFCILISNQIISILMPRIHQLFISLFAISFFITSCEFFEGSSHIDADDPNIEYIGRFDYSNPKSVRFDWPGVQIITRFEGTSCSVKLKDGNKEKEIIAHPVHLKAVE